jgi:hypothetical protein
LTALKNAIASGTKDLAQGRYRTYDDSNLMQLAEEIGRSGRERLTKERKNAKG